MRLTGAFLLLITVAMPVWSADPAPSEEIPWYRRVFLGERSKPTPVKQTSVAKPAPLPPTRESIARTFEQEKEVYLQRLAAISKMKEIANSRDDEAMMKKANELEETANALFEERTARLKNSTLAADRAALEKKPTEDRPATAERPGQRRRPTTGGVE